MNPVSVSAPSVLDPATQLGHLNAAITKLEPQLPVAPTGHSTPASTSPNQPTQEQSLPMTPPRPNAMEPLVESFYEKDIEEELDEHFKKSQSETKTRRGKRSYSNGSFELRKAETKPICHFWVEEAPHLVETGRFISIFAAAAL